MKVIKLLVSTLRSYFCQPAPSQGIKLAVVGPPHSGKSVLVGLLRSLLPRDKFVIVEGAPDGEGSCGWSTDAHQEVTKAIRRKGKFLPEHIKWVSDYIRNTRMPVTLVDLGGMLIAENGEFSATGIRLTPQNEAFLRECTHVLVIANPYYAEAADTWVRLCEGLGLKLFAKLESVLEGADDEIFSKSPALLARITKLDRESPPLGSLTAGKLTELLLATVATVKVDDGSKVADVNFPKLAAELALPTRGESSDPDWQPRLLPRVLDSVSTSFFRNTVRWLAEKFGSPLRLWGNTAIGWPWHALACAHKAVAYYYPQIAGYITLPHLVPSGTGSNQLNWKIEVRENHVLVHYDIPQQIFPVQSLPEIVPPAVLQGLPVIISGKGPRFLASSLLRAYYLAGAPAVAAFEPGETGRLQADGRKWAEVYPGQGSAVVVASHDKNIKLGTVIPFPLLTEEKKC